MSSQPIGPEASSSSAPAGQARHRNRTTAVVLLGVIGGMLALTAAAVPLYDLFCRVTGFGGTTQRAEAVPAEAAAATVTVYFNADTAPDLPWRFEPAQRKLEVHPGEEHLAFYEAVNVGDQPVVGQAVFNVTPFKVGAYFAKLHCFCFEEQLLEPGERVDMPVSFFVDPAMFDDAAARDVRQITLSYTFFVDAEATEALRQQRAAVPQG